MIDAPYSAAERVFDTAIHEQVKLVVLSGNLLDLVAPHPRSICFLREQFERLAGHAISVCWAGSPRDSAAQWPSSISLPASVHHFSAAAVDTISLEKELKFPLTVVGRSGDEQWRDPRDGLLRGSRRSRFWWRSPAGKRTVPALSVQPIDYWALGGRGDRKTVVTEPRACALSGHTSGTSSGRCGTARLHDWWTSSRLAQVRLRFVSCETARWQHERVLVAASAPWEDLEDKLAERMQDLRDTAPSGPLLVRWTLVATDVAEGPTVWRELVERTEKWLRKQAAASPIRAGRCPSKWKSLIASRPRPTRKTRCWATTCGRSGRCRTTRDRRT